MPIKPENKDRYPANWLEIRDAILERAGHRCEKCRAANRTRICRGAGANVDTYLTDEADVFDAETGAWLGKIDPKDYQAGKMVEIVLTIAHLNHVPEDVDFANLRAWCQRCHLRYDAKYHAQNARYTRRAKLAVADLFD